MKCFRLFAVGVVVSLALGSWAQAQIPEQCPESRTYTFDDGLDEGTLINVNHDDVADQLQLSTTITTFPFAWIANDADGTMSKVDTATGMEIGRYHTGPAGGAERPSRTAVDRDGNCWVANRAFDANDWASVTQVLVDGGIDRDGSGTIETSQDLDNSGIIGDFAGELLAWGADERVARHYLVGADASSDSVARGLTLDAAGFVWVGLWNSQRILKLDPTLDPLVYTPFGALRPPELASIGVGHGTYGLALGPNGLLYLATLSTNVLEIDPGAGSGGSDPPRVLQTVAHSGTNYGIAVDANGSVWMADVNNNRCICWDPSLGAAGISYGPGAASRGRGITVDFDGNIWMACDQVNGVAKYAPTVPPTLLFNAAAGGALFPIGVGVAADGHVIAVGQSSDSWGKINKDTGATIVTGGPQLVGSGPYTYSDFTGSLQSIVLEQGSWTVVRSGPLGTEWNTIRWNQEDCADRHEPDGTSLTVEVRAAETMAGLGGETYVEVINGEDLTLLGIVGAFIEVRVTFDGTSDPFTTPVLCDLTIEAKCGFLDIKPGSCPNSFNRNSHGVLPVSLLGTDTFDATQVDLSSIQLCRADGIAGCVAPHEGPPGPHSVFSDAATPFDGELCNCHELTGDGITDLSMKFKVDGLVAALEMDDFSPGALVELTLFGETLDGTPFEASDCVRLVPPGTPPGQLRVDARAVERWINVSPLDLQLDGGGFGSFERDYPLTSEVTIIAPPSVLQGEFFHRWVIDGVPQPFGLKTITLTIRQDLHQATALYGEHFIDGAKPGQLSFGSQP